MYDWFPLVFFPFKIIVLGVGMFLSIKWHHDQGKKSKARPAGNGRLPDQGAAGCRAKPD
jgi:hypothetical protein